jgi:NADH:ubiquinone oxidoreductase subunit 3 (subunit A)
MNQALVDTGVAFLIYLLLAGSVYALGRALAGPARQTAVKSSTYASGEAPPARLAAPGYRPFFVVALFFAALHLGVLVMGSGGFNAITSIYLVGLMLALLALILG